eukprot:CAMPEP_0117463306 /NCGR_PEP_ID=MMETSP0784-20121206/3508_1 /TAXON_ID=39447 /ORGANISM="" /LENGTH=40 /DNA_ID= /DNA_START= /DNA_END= /DNA_ORIENTATION=
MSLCKRDTFPPLNFAAARAPALAASKLAGKLFAPPMAPKA